MPTINGRACVVNGTPVDKVFSNGKIVYGRNLLLDTIDYYGWGKDSTLSIDSSAYPGVAHYPLTTVTTNVDFFKKYGLTFLEPSTPYTLSFKAKGSGLLNVYVFPDVSTSGTGDNFHQYQLTSDYKIYSFSFVTSSNISGYKTVLFRNGVTTLEAYITQVKLEKDDLATPWTPAPEDVM